MTSTFEFLSSLLRRPAARRTLFALAPIGYAITVLLVPAFRPGARAGFRIGRTEALHRATTLLSSHGFTTDGWRTDVRTAADDDLTTYMATLPPGEAAALAAADPGVFLRVSFWKSDGSLDQVWFAPDGNVYRWLVKEPGAKALATSPEADRRVAEDALARRLGPAALSDLRFEHLSDEASGVSRLRRFAWSRPGAAASEYAVSVRSGRLAGESVRVRPPDTPSAAVAALHRAKVLRNVTGVSFTILAVALLIWGAVRWLMHLRDKEVSLLRGAVLGAGVFLLIGPMFFLGLFADQLQKGEAPEAGAVIAAILFISIFLAAIAFVSGMAWAGGEGDLRRLFPEKLASADALLSGHFFSRNVGRALLAGLAVGGIGSAAVALASAAAAGLAPRQPITTNEVILVGFPVPWLLVPSGLIWGTILTTLGAILLGIPLAARFFGGKARALVVVGAVLALIQFADTPGTSVAVLLLVVVAGVASSAMQIVAFAAGDLVASFTASFGFGLAHQAAFYLAQPNAEMRAGGVSILALLAALVLASALAAWKGREWSERELLPAYARRMVVNDDVRAEMDLARDAQQRLLSRTPDGVPGIALAKDVVPASTVGGDYVDAFPRPDGGLLWIVADGGGRGAGAALAMTLTRGLLLALASGGLDAPEVARTLRARLTQELGEDAVPSFVVGASRQGGSVLALARVGAVFPKVAIRQASGGVTPVAFSGSADATQTAEWSLATGDGVLAWTDGVESLADVWGAPLGERGLMSACEGAPPTAAGLRDKLRARLERYAGGLAPGALHDDIALLVIARVERGSDDVTRGVSS